IDCKVVFFCDGKDRKASDISDHVFIYLSSTSEGWKLLDYNTFGMLYDDRRFSEPEPNRRGSVLSGGIVLEQLWVKVGVKQFLELISSKEIKATIGIYKFSFTVGQRAALTDCAARLGVTGAEARVIANRHVQAKADRLKDIREAWDDVLKEANRVVRKLPVRK